MIMNKLLLHPIVSNQLDNFAAKPSHALLVVGYEGIGKSTICKLLTIRLLKLSDESKLETYPHLKIIQPDDKSISIEAIRELKQFTKLKISSQANEIQRVIVIEHAETLTIEAQNALLKLLEEPPTDTVLILATTTSQALLPTIRSRSQTINIKQPTREAIVEYFEDYGFKIASINQAYLLSGGLVGLMSSLLEGKDDHPLSKTVLVARKLLQATTFDRLTMVDSLSKQRDEYMRLLLVLQQMSHAALEQAVTKEMTTTIAQTIKRWQCILKETYAAETALLTNAQPKLVLTNLLLNL